MYCTRNLHKLPFFLLDADTFLVPHMKLKKDEMALTKCILAPNTSRDLRHLVWRIPQVEQLGPPHPPALLSTSASSTLNDFDFLQVWRIDEELHLDTRPLNDVS